MNRRASIIGPLVLILVGGIFLLHNLNRDLSILRTVAQFWPWILIGWGAIRLAEVLFWHQKGQPLPRAGVSGGEWWFVVFLCMLGSGTAGVMRVDNRWSNINMRGWGWQIMGEQFDFPVKAEAPAANVTRIVVENLRGSARIVGTGDASVKVNGHKTVRALDRSTAERADRETPLQLVREGDVLYIRTSQEKWSGDERISADIDITVPKSAMLECKSRVGDFDITDMRNAVVINSDNSGVRLQNIVGKVEISVRKSDIVRAVNIQGDVTLKGSGQDLEFDNITGQVTADFAYTGDLEFKNLAKPLRFESNTVTLNVERVPGRLQLTRSQIEGENLVGPLRIKSGSKDVRVAEFTGAAEIEVERGDIRLTPGRGPLGAIDARTRSGEIEVALPEKGGFSLKAQVTKGSAENDYGAPLTKVDEGRTERITGTTGAGPLVSLEASRGSIRVRKAGAVVAKAEDQ